MHWLERHWDRKSIVSRALVPVAGLYCLTMSLRRALYRAGVLRATRLPVPVVIVGNLTVGGTGKTPLVAWLARLLKESGYRPGILTRGYGARPGAWPRPARNDSDPAEVGDEPLLLARNSDCPVMVDPDRIRAGRALIRDYGCQVLIADDGLQHLRLLRDLEIGVRDGTRRFGNGYCLPAGPLREPSSRWDELDIRIVQGSPSADEYGMILKETGFYPLSARGPALGSDAFRGQRAHAVAGIAHPARFFDHLRRLGLEVIEHPFPDHHPYKTEELMFADDCPIIMTQKDAVKCQRLPGVAGWYLGVIADPDPRVGPEIIRLLKERSLG